MMLMTLSISACIRNGVANYCDYKPVYFQEYDRVTVITGKKIIANNEKWERFCK